MSNSIRVKSKTEYVIEVNDKGETISFDTADTGLTSRLFKMYEGIERLTEEYKAKGKAIDERPDEPMTTMPEDNPITGETVQRVLLTRNQYDGAQLIDQFYSDARKVLDKFLGEGACMKIFGEKNYQTMFEDLMEQLTPEFKKMGLNAEAIRTSAAKKHGPKENKYRTVK